MHLATPSSRLGRGVQRLALTICAIVALVAAPAPPPESTVEDEPVRVEVSDVTSPLLPPGRPVGAVAGRAPPTVRA
jgi:hypothetical protein